MSKTKSASQKSQRPNKRNWILITVVAVVILCALLFAARGWIRGDLAPWIISQTRSSEVDDLFVRDFIPINQQLAQSGLKISDTFTNSKTECRSEYFQFLYNEINCERTYTFSQNVTDNFKDTWSTESPNLESLLLENGWVALPSPLPNPADVTEILDFPEKSIRYVKQNNSHNCEQVFSYKPHQSDTLAIRQSCQIIFKVFAR